MVLVVPEERVHETKQIKTDQRCDIGEAHSSSQSHGCRPLREQLEKFLNSRQPVRQPRVSWTPQDSRCNLESLAQQFQTVHGSSKLVRPCIDIAHKPAGKKLKLEVKEKRKQEAGSDLSPQLVRSPKRRRRNRQRIKRVKKR